jgi:hypothetical protein
MHKTGVMRDDPTLDGHLLLIDEFRQRFPLFEKTLVASGMTLHGSKFPGFLAFCSLRRRVQIRVRVASCWKKPLEQRLSRLFWQALVCLRPTSPEGIREACLHERSARTRSDFVYEEPDLHARYAS